MSERFERVGLDFRFAPIEVKPITLLFQRVEDKGHEVHCEVVVFTLGQRLITRHLNLKSSPTRGLVADLIKELAELTSKTPQGKDDAERIWRPLLREAAENVINAFRQGRPIQRTEGVIVRPAPPAWLSKGLLLKNKPNCWLGAASTGKSTLAKALCAYYATGYRFCDREMERGVPLFLDWEDDKESFDRTVYDVCTSLGVHSLPLMLWRDMHGTRLRDHIESLAREIDEYHVGLIVLDAIAAAGGSTGEHMTWEAIALELEQCLGALPPVTLLALDHVTGAEHRAQRSGGPKPPVPIKARGSERKLEFFRSQWTLVADVEAEALGRHVIEWTHTKNNFGPKEPPFATEIIHRDSEISVVLRPLRVPEEAEAERNALLAALALATDQRPVDIAWRLDGKSPEARRVDSVRRMLDREVERGNAFKHGRPARYSLKKPDSYPEEGVLITFPGGA